MVIDTIVIEIGVSAKIGVSGDTLVINVVNNADTKILDTNNPRLRITRFKGCKYSFVNTSKSKITLINSTSSNLTCMYANI